jgi:D-glycero-alpha-D-manno-heptose-7-phosphate kinase
VGGFGDRYPVVPGAPRTARHPLVEAAVDACPPPPGSGALEVTVRSAVPAGSGTGTSASVAVALLAGLRAVRCEPVDRREIAYAAHRLEVDGLGAESGVQDQLCAAFGGINYLEIEPYPEAVVHPLPRWDMLAACLSLVFLGRAHHSSEVHRRVIECAPNDRPEVFARLRHAALVTRDAVMARDLPAFGEAMIANTEAQMSLHPDLVGPDAREVISFAAERGSPGWKVNGAGGDGGTVTVLSATPRAKERFERELGGANRRYRVLPIDISTAGLEVRGSL